MFCVLISYISGGTCSLKSTPNDKIFYTFMYVWKSCYKLIYCPNDIPASYDFITFPRMYPRIHAMIIWIYWVTYTNLEPKDHKKLRNNHFYLMTLWTWIRCRITLHGLVNLHNIWTLLPTGHGGIIVLYRYQKKNNYRGLCIILLQNKGRTILFDFMKRITSTTNVLDGTTHRKIVGLNQHKDFHHYT